MEEELEELSQEVASQRTELVMNSAHVQEAPNSSTNLL